MRRVLSLFAVTVLLSSCSGLQSHTEVEALNEAKPVGSPFTQRLSAEYKDYMKSRNRWMDYSDGRHFARKGLMAAQGKVPMPELLSNWHLTSGQQDDLGAARTRLVTALDNGGRNQAPFEAAVAQARFDCWIERAEEWTSIGTPSCRAEFEQAMTELDNRLGTTNPPSDKLGQPVPPREVPKAPVVEPAPAPAEPKEDPSAVPNNLDEGMFLVFFDFNKSALNDTGNQVIDAIAEQVKKRTDLKTVEIVGHADTSGSDKYNQRLSQRRADAVKAALVKRGVSAATLSAVGRGEKDLMVPTANDTREPANRRVSVEFK